MVPIVWSSTKKILHDYLVQNVTKPRQQKVDSFDKVYYSYLVHKNVLFIWTFLTIKSCFIVFCCQKNISIEVVARNHFGLKRFSRGRPSPKRERIIFFLYENCG